MTNQTDEEVNTNMWSTVMPNTARADRGEIRRAHDPTIHPEMGVCGCRTLYEGLRHGAALNPLGPCLGFRAVSSTGFATPYIYSSYTEIVARVESFAAGLDVLDLVTPNTDNMKLIAIYIPNCIEWVITEHGIYTIGGATVPLYDTLGPDTVKYILAQTGSKSVVCARRNLDKVCEAKQSGECPAFTTAIVVDGVTSDAAKMAEDAGLDIISFAKVEAVGAKKIAEDGHAHSPPSFDDVATFCYTSGTTGTPKGALITHGNLVSTSAGMHHMDELNMTIADRHLSYLPLPHIFERVVMSQALIAGASIAFFRGDPLMLIEDLQACRPTVMPAAPRVLNKIYDKIINGINTAGGMKKKIFDAALAAKTEGLKHGHLKHGLYDRLLFNKIKYALGLDHIRLMISGSAPLSDNVMTFFRCMLGAPIIEGYGQTEGCAAATIGHPQYMSTVGHVGGPTGVVEIALYDVPEMGYLHTDTEHRGQPCQGRGEICIRGLNVFKGYYKEEEKTKEAIDEEGWLHSGDIGLWRPDGTLQIIDRKKNIFKLAQGEYVAPEKIENILMHSPLIAQIFVHGESTQSSLVAIVVPDEEVVRGWAETNAPTIKNASMDELCKSSTLKDAIMDDILRLSKESKLNGYETVKSIMLLSTPFSIENDLMTPTFKLKRQKIRDTHEKDIEVLYSSQSTPRSKL